MCFCVDTERTVYFFLGVATFVYQLNNDTKPSVIICKNKTCSNKLINISEAVEYLSKSD